MPLPLEEYGRFVPLPGTVYLERDEQPETYGNYILVPESYRTKVKSSLSTVLDVGAGVPVLQKGDRVLVVAGVGRRIIFGDRDEHVVYVAEYPQIIALVLEESAQQRIEEIGEAWGGRFPIVSARAEHAREGKADEGVEKRGVGE